MTPANTARRMNVEAEIVSEEAFEALVAGARRVSEVPFIQTASAHAHASADVVPLNRKTSARNAAPTENRINGAELMSIYAVLAYVAHCQNERQELLQHLVETQFRVDHISKIAPCDYRRALEFLVDLRLDEIRSRK